MSAFICAKYEKDTDTACSCLKDDRISVGWAGKLKQFKKNKATGADVHQEVVVWQ